MPALIFNILPQKLKDKYAENTVDPAPKYVSGGSARLRCREGNFSQGSRPSRFPALPFHLLSFIIVELDNDIFHLSRGLIKKHPLRAYDAVHRASAKSLKNRLKTVITFACADRRLSQSAEAEGPALLSV